MWLTPAQMHAANLRLSENLDKLSPDALNFPSLLQSLFWGRHEQETVSLCAMLRWCLFVLSLLVLSPALVLRSSCQKQEKTLFCPSGCRAGSQSSQESVLCPVSFVYESKATPALEEMEGALRICPELVVALPYHSWGVGAAEAGWVQFLLCQPSSKAKTQVTDQPGPAPQRSSLKVARRVGWDVASLCAPWLWRHRSSFACVSAGKQGTSILRVGGVTSITTSHFRAGLPGSACMFSRYTGC